MQLESVRKLRITASAKADPVWVQRLSMIASYSRNQARSYFSIAFSRLRVSRDQQAMS